MGQWLFNGGITRHRGHVLLEDVIHEVIHSVVLGTASDRDCLFGVALFAPYLMEFPNRNMACKDSQVLKSCHMRTNNDTVLTVNDRT